MNRVMTGRIVAGGEPGRCANGTLIWGALVVLILVALVHRLAHMDRLVVPAPDFYAYQQLGVHLLRAELPAQRVGVLPGLPVLMASLGSVLPGPRSVMYAGQVISVAASLSLFPLLFALGRRLLGTSGALFLVWLFCFNPEVSAFALQPITDCLFLALTVGAAWAVLRGSPWAYALGGVAALVRYEGILLIIAIFVTDTLVVSRRLNRLAFCVAALLPIYGWLALVQAHNASIPGPQEAGEPMLPVGLTFIKVVAATALEHLPRAFAVTVKAGSPLSTAVAAAAFGTLLILAGVGFRGIMKRDSSMAWFVLAFGVPFVGVHMWVSAATQRYALPILWLFYLAVIAGVHEVVRWAPTRVGAAMSARLWALACAAGVATYVAVWALWPPVRAAWSGGLLLSAPLLAYLSWVAWRRQGAGVSHGYWHLVRLTAGAVGIVFLGVGTYDYTHYCLRRDQSRFAELVPFAQWLGSAASPACRVVCEDEAFFILTKEFDVSPARLVNVASLPAASAAASARSRENILLLWNQSSFAWGALDKHSERKNEAFGLNAELIQSVHNGAPGWRALRRFEKRRKTAVVYAPSPPRQNPISERGREPTKVSARNGGGGVGSPAIRILQGTNTRRQQDRREER